MTTAIDLTPRVTAPDFGTDPIGYYTWHLLKHPEMYAAFVRYADQYRAVQPDRRVSADMICHVLRFQTGLHAKDDTYAVNNVLTPLYARLYRRHRPGANIPTRTSQLDTLTESEWAALLACLPDGVPEREVQA
jgi:hypothetical protein